MKLNSQFVGIEGAAKELGVDLDALREMVIRRTLPTYAHVRRWPLLWIPDQLNGPECSAMDDDYSIMAEFEPQHPIDSQSDSASLPARPTLDGYIEKSQVTESAESACADATPKTKMSLVHWERLGGRPVVTIEDGRGNSERIPIVRYTGFVRLQMDEAADAAAAKNFSTITVGFEPVPCDMAWKGGGMLMGIEARESFDARFRPRAFRLRFADLWLATKDIIALRSGGAPVLPPDSPPLPLAKMNEGVSEYHARNREPIFAYAFALLAVRGDDVKRVKGKLIVDHLVKVIEANWQPLYRGKEAKKLSSEHMATLLNGALDFIRKLPPK